MREKVAKYLHLHFLTFFLILNVIYLKKFVNVLKILFRSFNNQHIFYKYTESLSKPNLPTNNMNKWAIKK